MKYNIKWLTSTAMYIALIIASQLVVASLPIAAVTIGPIKLSQLLTGTLVNMFLFASCITSGTLSSIFAGIVSAFAAALFGINLPLPQMVFLVALGNASLAFSSGIIKTKFKLSSDLTKSLFVLIPSAIKFLILWLGVNFIVVPFFGPAPAVATVIKVTFSYPQLITAILGGFLSLKICTRIKQI